MQCWGWEGSDKATTVQFQIFSKVPDRDNKSFLNCSHDFVGTNMEYNNTSCCFPVWCPVSSWFWNFHPLFPGNWLSIDWEAYVFQMGGKKTHQLGTGWTPFWPSLGWSPGPKQLPTSVWNWSMSRWAGAGDGCNHNMEGVPTGILGS